MLFESLESMYSRLQKLLTESFSVLFLIPINQLVCLFGSVYRPHKPDLLIFEVFLLTPKARPQKSYKKLRKVTNELRTFYGKLKKYKTLAKSYEIVTNSYENYKRLTK